MDLNLSDLDYNLYLWVNEDKVLRISCNFLVDQPFQVVGQWLEQVNGKYFYTHVSIDYQGEEIFKAEIPAAGSFKLFPF